MNKEKLTVEMEAKLNCLDKSKSLGELVGTLGCFAEENLDLECNSWLFQVIDCLEMPSDVNTIEKAVDFIKANLDKYCYFYLELYSIQIEPCCIADIWFSFELTNSSKKIVFDTLDTIKNGDYDDVDLVTFNQVIDTIMVCEYDILNKLELSKISIVK